MPLSLLYGAVSGSRRFLYAKQLRRSTRLARPVIIVGNLTVGGTGKTPVVRALVRRLGAARGETQILTRGYGGKRRGPLLVAPSLHTAADVGDEALMLTADAPVWVAHDRAAGALAAAAGGAAVMSETFEQIAGELQQLMLGRTAETGIAAEFRSVRGDPLAELTRIAEETRADAVVVGASEHLGHRIVGSLANRLIRAGKWPVTVVP